MAIIFQPSVPLANQDNDPSLVFRTVITLSNDSNGIAKFSFNPGTGPLDITSAYFGRQDPALAETNPTAMLDTPIQITFGGNSGFTSATAIKESDLIDHSAFFEMNAGDNIVVTFRTGSNGQLLYSASNTNAVSYFSNGTSGDDDTTQIPSNNGSGFSRSGGSTGANNFALNSVEIVGHVSVDVTAGEYSVTGTDITVDRVYILATTPHTYDIHFDDKNLFKGLIAQLTGGSFGITGTDAGLFYGAFALGSGTYELVGGDVEFFLDRGMTTTGGVYAINNGTTILVRKYTAIPTGASFAWTGSDIAFSRDYNISAGAKTYGILGSSIIATKSVPVPYEVTSGTSPYMIYEID